MGLCKCRTVTNLFCFQHRKNVCEKCIASDHEKCVVRSYLQWLQDSDFDPSCALCRKELTEDTIRLTCLDIFHVDCINEMCNNLPENTSKSGYACPVCNMPLLPSENAGSAIAQKVRAAFENTAWAKRLASMINTTTPSSNSNTVSPITVKPVMRQQLSSNISLGSPVKTTHSNHSETSISIPVGDSIGGGSSSSIINMGGAKMRLNEDPDEVKYGRRSATSVLGGLGEMVYTFKRRMSRRQQVLFITVVLILFILIMGRYRNSKAPIQAITEEDPSILLN